MLRFRPLRRCGSVVSMRAMESISCRDRYARSVVSSDLTPRSRSTLAPLDLLGAAGMAAQRHELGMLLQRLRADATPTATAVAAAALAERLRAAVRRRQVRRDGVDSEVVAAQALAWWLNPTCLACGGVQFVARNARLISKSCAGCRGSGLRALESAAPAAAAWVLDAISREVDQSEAAHRRVLR